MATFSMNFVSRARLYVPASLVLDEAALDRLPADATYEVIREGGMPQQWPDDHWCLFFDFLLYDGSVSCAQWMHGLLEANVLDPVTFLLHAPDQDMRGLEGWELPRFACDLNDVRRWQRLPYAMFQSLDGVSYNHYGEIRAAFPRQRQQIKLLERRVGDRRRLYTHLARQLPPTDGAYLSSVMVNVTGPSLDSSCMVCDPLDAWFDGLPWPLWQASIVEGPRPWSITMVLSYCDGEPVNQPCPDDAPVRPIRFSTLPPVTAICEAQADAP